MAMKSSPSSSDFVDLADVRMIDAGRGPRFAPEAPSRGLVMPQRRHRLERHGALEARIARGIDNAHSPFTQLSRNRVGSDARGQGVSNLIAGGTRKGRG